MSFSLIPDISVPSIFFLTPEFLAKRGLTLLLLDLDNTLTPYTEGKPTQAVMQWLLSLQEAGVSAFIVSNSRKSTRAGDYAAAAGIPYVRRAGKPSPRALIKVMEEMGGTPEHTAMAGDQVFTDVLAGNRANVTSIAVRPMAFTNPGHYPRYAIEQPFRWLSKEKIHE